MVQHTFHTLLSSLYLRSSLHQHWSLRISNARHFPTSSFSLRSKSPAPFLKFSPKDVWVVDGFLFDCSCTHYSVSISCKYIANRDKQGSYHNRQQAFRLEMPCIPFPSLIKIIHNEVKHIPEISKKVQKARTLQFSTDLALVGASIR